MADRSFKEYIGNRFYDQFFIALKSYVIQNRHSIELSSRTVSNADYAELSDFTIKTVGIDDREEMGIAFDIIVEAEVYVKEHHRHRDIDEDTCFPWFILSCTADLSKNMDDLSIHRVDQYNQRNKQNKPLSDSLVPINYKIDLDKVATEFLRKHYPEALRTPMPVDPMVLADRLGLSVVTQELTEDFSVFGQIFFQDCDSEAVNFKTGEKETVRFPAKTIVVDPKAFLLRNLGSVNNTIVHECVHWDQHRKAFELERLYNSEATQIKCLVIGGSKGSSDRTAADWMEWQANSLAPRIQMPIGSFKTKAAEFVRKFQREMKAAHIVDVMEAVIDALATFFVVSRHAAKMRMVDAGYEEAIGAFTYIDGHYVKPHAFKKGSLQKDQTYCISADDAQIIAFSDMRLFAQAQKGSYIYVDSHMCLNDPKYVTRDENNAVQMTDYGRLHIDECCLVFTLKVKATNKFGEEFYKECVLFRDVDSGIVFQTTFAKEVSDDVMGKADAILAREAEIQKVLQELPAKFGDALVYLMDWVEISEETLAEKALVSTKLVQRLRNNPAYPKNVDCVVAVSIGMNLPPELSNALISRSGFTLRLAQNEAHLMYNFFLNHLYMGSIHECNDMLVAKKPAGDDRRRIITGRCIAVDNMTRIREFAIKWCGKFRDQNINYIELVDHYMADDCAALGFEMDCGHAFSEKYGNAANDCGALEAIIGQVTDIPLLGSAIFSRWRYFNHWAYSGEEILEPQNRTWFTMALSRLSELANCQLMRFNGTAQKIRIVSNNICYGPAPEPDEEVEQHITINSEGRVWFSAYTFGSGYSEHEKSRSKIYKIDKATATKVLDSITAYFSGEYIEVFAADIGEWDMEITNTEGKVYKFRGSLCADFEVDGTDLSDMVREALGMDDLYVFDGNNKPDRVDRVTIDYHRITKIKPQTPVSDTVEYVTWDYTEKLVLDRESETLEHIQNIGSGCIVSRKYYVQGGVEGLLDDIDADELFGEIEGNPDDVIDTPLESKDYTITVDFKKGPQRVIQGTYDKRALPEFWGDFADAVWQFIRFYGCGEMLDPAVYEKVKRRKQDYIYCSVEFEEGYKSYYYIADEDNISVGDYVIVPVGKDNHHSVAEVVTVEYFAEEIVPLSLDRTKHIIRKCTDDDFDPPEVTD